MPSSLADSLEPSLWLTRRIKFRHKINSSVSNLLNNNLVLARGVNRSFFLVRQPKWDETQYKGYSTVIKVDIDLFAQIAHKVYWINIDFIARVIDNGVWETIIVNISLEFLLINRQFRC
jgi:hypothetical protein